LFKTEQNVSFSGEPENVMLDKVNAQSKTSEFV